MSAPSVFRKHGKVGSGLGKEGVVFAVTTSRDPQGREKFFALIDTRNVRVFGEVTEGVPEIGSKVTSVLRIISKGPPVEYGVKWKVVPSAVRPPGFSRKDK